MARLDGASHEGAVFEASEKFHRESSVIGEAWAAHKQDALLSVRVERGFDKDPWTEWEKRLLSEIFSKMEMTIRDLLGSHSGKKAE